MTKISRSESSLLKGLMREQGWEILLRLMSLKIDEWNSQEITGSNEFETLRALHTKNGRVEGLTDFFDDLDKKAFD